MVAGSKMTTSAAMPSFEHLAAVGREAHPLRGQRCEFADGFLERKLLLFAHVLAKNMGECTGSGPRMRMLLAEQTVGRGSWRVIADCNPGLLQRQRHVGLGWHDKQRHAGA